jgi:hypothetical protein
MSVPRMIPLIAWIKRKAPDYIREHYFNKFQLADVLRLVASDWATELGYGGGLLGTLSRDFVKGYNWDWRRFVTDGIPPVQAHEPQRPRAREAREPDITVTA